MGENYSVIAERQTLFKTIQPVEVECLAKHWWQIRIISKYDGEVSWIDTITNNRPQRFFTFSDAKAAFGKVV